MVEFLSNFFQTIGVLGDKEKLLEIKKNFWRQNKIFLDKKWIKRDFVDRFLKHKFIQKLKLK